MASDSGQFLTEVVSHGNAVDIRDCVNRLQEEMRKIDAFKRELPLCMLLVKDAIEKLNQELSLLEKADSVPVLEQFLPLKNKGEEEEEEDVIENDNKDKMNWMSSVQLWSSGPQIHHPDTPNIHKKDVIRSSRPSSPAVDLFSIRDKAPLLSLSTVETKDLKQEMINSSGLSSSRSMASSSAADSKLNSKTMQISKKQRRCWSPDLHRKFVNVLQQLGGAQVATPKQIRELMQVDGLTNDEVKSHLQKYRLHVRRAPSTSKVSVIFEKAAKSREDQLCKTSKNSHSPTGSLELARSMMEDYEDDDDEVSEINNQ